MADRSRILLGSVAALAIACGGPAATGTPAASPAIGLPSRVPAATVGSPAPRPEPSALLPSSLATGEAWEGPVRLEAADGSGAVTAVAAGPGGWVAVGGTSVYRDIGGGHATFVSRTGLVWTSPDGLDWTSVDADRELANATLYGVAWTSQGFVAVGTWTDERPDPTDPGVSSIYTRRPAAWRSGDGTTWQALPVQGIDTGGTDLGRLNDVVEVDGILIGVGCLDDYCVFGPAVWLAGRSGAFEPVTSPADRVAASAWSATATLGGVVAVGEYNSVGNEPMRAAAWRSVDGGIWAPAQSIEDATFATLRDVARHDATLVAVGGSFDVRGDPWISRPAAWRSIDDGRTWQRAGLGRLDAEPGWRLDAVVWTGRTFVAVGLLSQSSPAGPIGWLSIDGLDWQPIEMSGSDAPRALADGPGGIVAVGGNFGSFASSAPPGALGSGVAWRSAPSQ